MGWHVHISSEKIKWMRIIFTSSCIFKPQSFQMDLHYNDWESLGIPSTFQKEMVWQITIGLGAAVLALETKSNHWKHATGLQSISIYCCTCQSLNRDKSSPRIYFQTFIIMMIICTDWSAFSSFYSKATSLSQDTILMTHNGILLLAKQSHLVWVWIILRKHT